VDLTFKDHVVLSISFLKYLTLKVQTGKL